MQQVTIVGVDIAKDKFDVEWRDGVTHSAQYMSDDQGFRQFVAEIPRGAHIVMEATGTYHLRLATYLHDAGRRVSVVNPAKPKYFARMKLKRAKTDPLDAGVMRQYGEYEEDLALWQPPAQIFIELNQLDRHVSRLQGDLNRVINRLEALQQCVTVNEFALRDLEAQQEDLRERVKAGEREIEQLVRHHFGELYELIRSIPGVGKKAAVMFIVMTEAFTRFPGAKEFASYLGMTSFVCTSGSSVKGGGGITRMGDKRMRQVLYMAALTAKTKNKACREFAARLKMNGKPAKVVRVAVANKLIRQVFAVFEKQETYSENFA